MDDVKAIACWSICNGASLNVYKQEFGRLLVGINDAKPRWHKIYVNSKHHFIIYNGRYWSLNDCIRL